MSSGIVILRTLRNLAIRSTLNYPSSRFTAAINQVPSRLCSTSEEKGPASEVQDTQDPKDRSIKIPVETSIRYLKSRAYAATYGEEPVWVPYKRNHKFGTPPHKTRRSCIKNDRLATNNPCPICRDEYLVFHESNVGLLKQFISPHTGEVLSYQITNICRRQHDTLMVSILRAQDQGLLTHDVPFRHYNYDDYKPKPEPNQQQQQQ